MSLVSKNASLKTARRRNDEKRKRAFWIGDSWEKKTSKLLPNAEQKVAIQPISNYQGRNEVENHHLPGVGVSPLEWVGRYMTGPSRLSSPCLSIGGGGGGETRSEALSLPAHCQAAMAPAQSTKRPVAFPGFGCFGFNHPPV
jgi:hypothetical protein